MKTFNTVSSIVCACINFEAKVFWWKCGKQFRRTWHAHGRTAQYSIYGKWIDNNLPCVNRPWRCNNFHRGRRFCVSRKKGQAGLLPKHPWNFIMNESTCNGIESLKIQFNWAEREYFQQVTLYIYCDMAPAKKGPEKLMRRKEKLFSHRATRENVCFPFSAMVDSMRSPWNFNILILPLRRFLFTPKEFRFINFTFSNVLGQRRRGKNIFHKNFFM